MLDFLREFFDLRNIGCSLPSCVHQCQLVLLVTGICRVLRIVGERGNAYKPCIALSGKGGACGPWTG